MNRHHCALFALFIGCGICGSHGQSQASAQVPPAIHAAVVAAAVSAADPEPELPGDWERIQSAVFISDSQRATISEFIQKQATRMIGADNAARELARAALCRAATTSVGGTPGEAFLDVYPAMLEPVLTPMAKHPRLRTRLNAAITAAKVAEVANNARLAGAAAAFLQDEAAPVAFYGMRIAKGVLPALLRGAAGGQDVPLVKAIAPVAKRFGRPEIVSEAYDTLSLPDYSAFTGGALVDVLELRVAQYANGLPDQYLIENRATLYLADSKVWPDLPTLQQARALQQMDRLVGFATRRTLAGVRTDRDDLNLAIMNTAKAIWVIGVTMKDDSIRDAAEPLTRPAQFMPARLVELAQSLQQAVLARPEFKAALSAAAAQEASPAQPIPAKPVPAAVLPAQAAATKSVAPANTPATKAAAPAKAPAKLPAPPKRVVPAKPAASARPTAAKFAPLRGSSPAAKTVAPAPAKTAAPMKAPPPAKKPIVPAKPAAPARSAAAASQ